MGEPHRNFGWNPKACPVGSMAIETEAEFQARKKRRKEARNAKPLLYDVPAITARLQSPPATP